MSVNVTKPPHSAAPMQTLSTEEPTEEPTPTPEPSAAPPASYDWPVDAAELFSPGAVPDDFSCPLYINGDGRMFLYATQDSSIRKAIWEGAGYNILPVVENVAAGPATCVYMDEAGQKLFCPGSRLFDKNSLGPTIVMADLKEGTRCNVDEAAAWKEDGCTVSSDFQYYSGRILSRLASLDGQKPLDKWALFDVERMTYSVLDMTGFLENHLPEWREMVSLRLAMIGENRLLAVCTVGDYKGPAATGSAAETRKPYECYAFLLDLSGVAVKDGGALIAGGEQPSCSRIQDGMRFNASPDGKYILYSGADQGLYLYDIDKNIEHTVLAGSGTEIVFAEWGAGGIIYYGAEGKQPEQHITIYQTNLQQFS